jgi:hypothetical protein
MLTVPGVTLIVASAPAVTVTEFVAETEPTATFTVFEYVAALSPAVKRPLELMVPPPCTTVHVGVTESVFPLASFTTAENCIVPPAGTEPPADESTIEAGVLGPVELSLPPHAASNMATAKEVIATLVNRDDRRTAAKDLPIVALRTGDSSHGRWRERFP